MEGGGGGWLSVMLKLGFFFFYPGYITNLTDIAYYSNVELFKITKKKTKKKPIIAIAIEKKKKQIIMILKYY